MSKVRSIKTLQLDSGRHCFNFTNTVHSRTEEGIFDYLKTYDDLIEWMEKVNLLSKARLKILKDFVSERPKEAEKKLLQIKNKRELLYQTFSSIIHNKNIDKTLVTQFNETLSEALSNLAFDITKNRIELGWKNEGVNLLEPLWVIFKDAFDILTSVPKKRIKECGSCGWLFLDNSKNNSRVWCSMQTCGSSDKAKRYYYRKKKERNNKHD